jgi:hypothetical protein
MLQDARGLACLKERHVSGPVSKPLTQEQVAVILHVHFQCYLFAPTRVSSVSSELTLELLL